jgi:tetratricopeptide (TPR) repeat protein
MRYIIACALLAVFINARCGLAVESASEAGGLAETGVALLAAGKTEKAQTMFYKALAYDSDCAVALYELGKMFEAESNSISATDFLTKALVALAKDKAAHPDYGAKLQEATRRLQKLNPYALQYNKLIEDYARNLCLLTKKCPDRLTAEDVSRRVDALGLDTLLPMDKLPAMLLFAEYEGQTPYNQQVTSERLEIGKDEVVWRRAGSGENAIQTYAFVIPPVLRGSSGEIPLVWKRIEGAARSYYPEKTCRILWQKTAGKIVLSLKATDTSHHDTNVEFLPTAPQLKF